MHFSEWAQRHNITQQALTELVALLDGPYGAPEPNNATSEAATQALCRVEAPKRGASLWRNNSGAGQMVEQDGSLRHLRWGLGNDSKKGNERSKSSDLIGITPMMSTAIGQVFGVFTAVECKHPGWTKPANKRDRAQEVFHKQVRRYGGLAMFAASIHDYQKIWNPTQ